METMVKRRPFYAFLGIRYGKAPVDELRFKVGIGEEIRTGEH